MKEVSRLFITWFEDLMEITGWFNCNFETQELQRSYWDFKVIPTYSQFISDDNRKEVTL